MLPKSKKSTGSQGESIATSYLRSLGFRIIEKNFRTRNGEIDLIGIEKNTLVFIEVKTRRTSLYGLPKESITPWKLRALVSCAHYYKLLHPTLPDGMRIDLISIILDIDDTVRSIELIHNISL